MQFDLGSESYRNQIELSARFNASCMPKRENKKQEKRPIFEQYVQIIATFIPKRLCKSAPCLNYLNGRQFAHRLDESNEIWLERLANTTSSECFAERLQS